MLYDVTHVCLKWKKECDVCVRLHTCLLRLLSRLLACSRARRRRRWGWGRRSVTSRVTRVKHATRVARHARARAYHHRFARVITVFRPPRARPARARCCGGGARSLARSRARGVALAVEVAFSYTARHARHASRARVHVITAHRARHHRSSSPHAPTRARCDGGGARSLDSARAVWRWQWRTVIRTSCVSRASRARARASSSSRHGTC